MEILIFVFLSISLIFRIRAQMCLVESLRLVTRFKVYLSYLQYKSTLQGNS
jgi:hypothetical protein